MFDTQSISGLTGSTNEFVTAYVRLLEAVERGLWTAGADGDLAAAQQHYADVVAEVVAMPGVEARLAEASQRLADVLAGALDVTSARETLAEAARAYVHELSAALPTISAGPSDVESIIAVASGMTTLAWLYGLGSSGVLGALTSTTPFSSPAYGRWPMAANDTNGNPSDLSATGWGGVETGHQSNGGEAADTASRAVDDDEIVWQEFSIGEDGQITERSVPSSGDQAAERASYPSAPPPPGADPYATRATSGGASATGDPVAEVERALRAYRDALASLGLPHEAVPDSGPTSPHGPSLEQSSADLTATYLRLMQGGGTLPELYASYARFVAASTLLVERQLGLVRMYEQLLAAAAAGRRPVDARRAADAQYQSFLSSVREVWSNVDTGALPPDKLAAMSASMAQAAEAHRAAMLLAGFSTSR